MEPRKPQCLHCGRPVTPSPEQFWNVGQGISGYLCYGCSRFDPVRVYRKIIQRHKP